MKTKQPKQETWRDDELERKKKVEAGETVVANLNLDHNLISWAEANNLATYIGSRTRDSAFMNSKWRNPRVARRPEDQAAICGDAYRRYISNHSQLQTAVHELKGKVLIGHSHPAPCHGHILAELANQAKEARAI